MIHPYIKNVSKIHFLKLSTESRNALFSDEHNSTGTEDDNTSQTQKLVNYFKDSLVDSDSPKSVTLYECVHISSSVFVVVDMESDPGERLIQGIITLNTLIYADGCSVEPLKTLHLYYIRPYTLNDALNSDTNGYNYDYRNKINYSADNEVHVSQHSLNSTDYNIVDFEKPLHRISNTDQLNGYVSSDTTVQNDVSAQSNEAMKFHSEQSDVVFANNEVQKEMKKSSFYQWRKKINFFNNAFPGSNNKEKNSNDLLQVNLLGIFHEALLNNPTTVFVRGNYVRFPKKKLVASSSHMDSFNNKLVVQLAEICNLDKSYNISSQSHFFTVSTGDLQLGIAVPGITQLKLELDPIGEFSDICISPIADTIPVVYQFDFFKSYIQPFIRTDLSRLYFKDNIFSYCGVQFKVKTTKPLHLVQVNIPDKNKVHWLKYDGIYFKPKDDIPFSLNTYISYTKISSKTYKKECDNFLNRCVTKRGGILCSRVGLSTKIYEGEATHLSWIDLIPSLLIDQIQVMPTRLQPFALMQAVSHLSPHELLRILGWSNEEYFTSTESNPKIEQEIRDTICKQIVDNYSTLYNPNSDKGDSSSNSDVLNQEINNSSLCIVCLEALKTKDQVLELPCSHVFHIDCVVQWIRQSLFCPICKRDIRNFLTK